VLVVDEGFELEAKNRLARIGFDRVAGFLKHPYVAMLDHPHRVRQASRLTAVDFDARRDDVNGLQLVDIRNPGEVALGTIAGATMIPVGQLPSRLDELDPAATTIVFCAGGYRSSVAASLLRQAGFSDVSDILGGYGAWQEVQPASL
jgi:hydroxyacylglutathione hydrolase